MAIAPVRERYHCRAVSSGDTVAGHVPAIRRLEERNPRRLSEPPFVVTLAIRPGLSAASPCGKVPGVPLKGPAAATGAVYGRVWPARGPLLSKETDR
jgi:hypothetical protein